MNRTTRTPSFISARVRVVAHDLAERHVVSSSESAAVRVPPCTGRTSSSRSEPQPGEGGSRAGSSRVSFGRAENGEKRTRCDRSARQSRKTANREISTRADCAYPAWRALARLRRVCHTRHTGDHAPGCRQPRRWRRRIPPWRGRASRGRRRRSLARCTAGRRGRARSTAGARSATGVATRDDSHSVVRPRTARAGGRSARRSRAWAPGLRRAGESRGELERERGRGDARRCARDGRVRILNRSARTKVLRVSATA